MSENADVIQGRLGWESGDVSEANVANLEPHPKNDELYGDTTELPETFVESVREKGVLEPLVITSDKQVISGHRRLSAAKEVGVESVPVRISEFETELAEREALIEFNRQREKTPGQIINEFEEMLEVKRQQNKKSQGERTDLSPDLERSDGSDSWQEAAEQFEVGKSTLNKGKKVKDKAESEDEPEEVKEAAEEAWEGLQSGDESFHSAYEEVKQAEREVEEQQQKEERETEREQSFESADSVVETFHGDFREVLTDYEGEIDHIVTDPPYDEDAVELWAALGEVAAEVLPEGGFVVAYSGKAHLPAVHDVLSDNLNYYWQGIVRHNGPGAKIFSRKLRTGYKPVVIYQKGDLEAQDDFVSDVVEGGGVEKGDHEWQQAESEAGELVERFTSKNDTICDPMCGSGTVGVACKRLQRKAVLIDKDADAVETARGKVDK